MNSTHMRRQRGVTLMELLTVVTVVAILASVAVPSYRRYIQRSQRSDATTTLLRVASAQEKHFLQYGTYVTTTADIGKAHKDGGLGVPATSEQGFYTIALGSTTTGYTATATPISGKGQHDDKDCVSFAVNENGTRTAKNNGGTDNTKNCFR